MTLRHPVAVYLCTCACAWVSQYRVLICTHLLFTDTPYLYTAEYYGVATISRLPKIIGPFRKRAL